MSRALRWLGYGLAALLALGMAGGAVVYGLAARVINQRPPARPEQLLMASADAGRGWHIIRTRGCGGCHGSDLRGDVLLDEPALATLYASNLTLLAARASDQQLAQALRQGIGHDGRQLFIMPSAQYSNLTDQEVSDVIAALRTAPRGGAEMPTRAIGQLGRLGLVNGKVATAPSEIASDRAHPPADLGPATAAGRHLAMTTCSGCHGSNLGGMETGPGVQSADLAIVGAYDPEQFARLMRTGLPPGGRRLEMMTDVSRRAFRQFSDVEVQQLFAYLNARAQR